MTPAPTETQVKPTGIVVDLARRLIQIAWTDGTTRVYDLDTLRRACPCAECRPWVHGVGKVGDISESAANAVGNLATMQDVQPVGSYALYFNWADGHNFGIYDWKYLHSLPGTEVPGDSGS